MRILDGKYVLSSKEQIEKALGQKDQDINALKARLGEIGAWARAELYRHQPYVHGLDLSCEYGDLQAALTARMKGNVWCAACSNPWPCKRIPGLRAAIAVARYGSPEHIETLRDLAEKARETKPREGQIGVVF